MFTRPRLDDLKVWRRQFAPIISSWTSGHVSGEETMSKRSNAGQDRPGRDKPGRDGAPDAGRRNFLKGATVASAAALSAPVAANTAVSGFPEQGSKAAVKAAVPGPKLAAADAMPPPADPVNQTSSGGDFMVDVLKTLDIDYLAMNCASSFRGLHEALINYGKNVKPEILTCN